MKSENLPALIYLILYFFYSFFCLLSCSLPEKVADTVPSSDSLKNTQYLLRLLLIIISSVDLTFGHFIALLAVCAWIYNKNIQ